MATKAKTKDGLPSIGKYRRLSTDQQGVIAAVLLVRYNEGRSIRGLASDTGYSLGRIRRLLIGAGVSFRTRGGSQRKPSTTAP